MKRYIYTFAFLICTFLFTVPAHAAYQYYVPITVTSSAAMTEGTHLVQSTNKYLAIPATSTVLSLAFNASTTAGNMLVVGISSDLAGETIASISDTLGNNFMLATNTTSTNMYLYYATSTVGGADTVSVNLNATTSYAYIDIAEYTGMASNPLDGTFETHANNSTIGPVTTSQSSDLLIGLVKQTPQSAIFSSPFIQRTNAIVGSYATKLADDDPYLSGSAGSYSMSMTGVTTLQAGILASFKTSGTGTLSLTNFPMLVSSTVTGWEASTTGGSARIQNLCAAPTYGGQEPCDLIFSGSTSCTSPYNYETENYVSSTGALVDWVQVPTLQAGTVIYACYGNSSVTSDQSHPSSTWDANFKGVWHLDDNAANTTVKDSTANGDNLTNAVGNTSQNATTTAVIGGSAFTYNYSTTTAPTYASSTSANLLNYKNFTWSGWLRTTTTTADYFMGLGTINGAMAFEVSVNKLIALRPGYANIITSQSTIPTSTWTYFSLTYDSTSLARGTIYINGQLDAVVGNPSLGGAPNTFFLGACMQTYCYSSWNGQLDEMRVATSSRNASWIYTEYNNQSSPSTFYSVGSEVATSVSTPGLPLLLLKNATLFLENALLKLL